MKSQIDSVLGLLTGTHEYDVLCATESVYNTIAEREQKWYEKSNVICPAGCGSCCVGFEPDLLDAEALYLAAWLIQNDDQRANKIAEGSFVSLRSDGDAGCILFDPQSPWHCTVYGGRSLICRLFGYSGDTGKDGKRRWKPCRFYPQALLAAHNPPLSHRQYGEDELKELFASLPPSMSDCMEQIISLCPASAGKTVPLRECLPAAIRRLKWLIKMNDTPEPRSA